MHRRQSNTRKFAPLWSCSDNGQLLPFCTNFKASAKLTSKKEKLRRTLLTLIYIFLCACYLIGVSSRLATLLVVTRLHDLSIINDSRRWNIYPCCVVTSLRTESGTDCCFFGRVPVCLFQFKTSSQLCGAFHDVGPACTSIGCHVQYPD